MWTRSTISKHSIKAVGPEHGPNSVPPTSITAFLRLYSMTTTSPLYPVPARDGYRLLTLSQLQSEARLMLAHVTKEPFQADKAAQYFSDELFRARNPDTERNAVNAAQIIGWAFLLSIAAEEGTA